MTYTAHINGHTWSQGPKAQFRTIRECRTYAESYGTTADYCEITDTKNRVVAAHRRDTAGNGTAWFRAEPAPR